MTMWHGISTMARHEVMLRLRSGRWRVLLGVWFVLVSGFTVLMHVGVRRTSPSAVDKGIVVYGALVLFVLALALLVVPTLTGQSVNGDRERGTLATLQVTLLSAPEIAVGKLLAAWGTSMVFVALTVPAMLYSVALGGVPIGRLAIVTLVVVLLLGVVAALALCLSSLLSRSTTSGVLSYLTVFGLCLGTLISFGLSLSLTQEHYTEQARCPSRADLQGIPAEEVDRILADCDASQVYEATRVRPDKVWWLLAPNPFVILADAAPQLPPLSDAEKQRRDRLQTQGVYVNDLRDSDPLGALGRSVRGLRYAPDEDEGRDRPVWPFGLAFDVALAGGAVWLTARRLRAPSRALPKGQRVA
jgi:ABC-type transport system involved in multi-copper enzyme maturation permease subunit